MDSAQPLEAARTGASSADEAATAAREAVSGALGDAVAQSGDVVFLFATSAYEPRPLVDAAVEAAAPARVVAGNALLGFVAGGGLERVVALHLPAGDRSIGVAAVPEEGVDLHGPSRDAAAQAKAAGGTEHPHSALVLVSSGHVGGQREVVQGAYEVTGAGVPIVGGAAASDEEVSPTWLAVDRQILGQGVAAVWLNSPEPLGVAVAHGWKPISRPLMVTRARDHVILELDGRPALDAYLDARGPMEQSEMPFGWRALDRPLGLPTLDGQYEVRMIKGTTDDGGLEMFAYVHDQSVVRLMAADTEALLEGARQATRAASAQLPGPPRAALVFSCAARSALLGEDLVQESAVMGEELPGIPAVGWFTSGEYALTSGATGFHNATVAVLAL